MLNPGGEWGGLTICHIAAVAKDASKDTLLFGEQHDDPVNSILGGISLCPEVEGSLSMKGVA